ncbi:MAG: hypothetical protein AB7N53_18900 [Candidatus Binatia bacterium]
MTNAIAHLVCATFHTAAKSLVSAVPCAFTVFIDRAAVTAEPFASLSAPVALETVLNALTVIVTVFFALVVYESWTEQRPPRA